MRIFYNITSLKVPNSKPIFSCGFNYDDEQIRITRMMSGMIDPRGEYAPSSYPVFLEFSGFINGDFRDIEELKSRDLKAKKILQTVEEANKTGRINQVLIRRL